MAPFLEVKHDSLHGNEKFEGYIPDLMKLLWEKVGFKYILRLVRDGNYGNKKLDGTWTGMIGEVMRQVCRMPSADNWGFHIRCIGLIGTIVIVLITYICTIYLGNSLVTR